MKPHPYLRAYMAGLFIPSLFMLAIFAFFLALRFGYNVDVPVERALVFPLALVPNLWAVWNLLYVAFSKGKLPLGVHGMLLPLILGPSGLLVSKLLGFELPGFLPGLLVVGIPIALAAYYLIWKYAVGWLNDLLGVG
jgi:hypothetical protein